MAMAWLSNRWEEASVCCWNLQQVFSAVQETKKLFSLKHHWWRSFSLHGSRCPSTYLSANTVQLHLQSLQEAPPLAELALGAAQRLVVFFDLRLNCVDLRTWIESLCTNHKKRKRETVKSSRADAELTPTFLRYHASASSLFLRAMPSYWTLSSAMTAPRSGPWVASTSTFTCSLTRLDFREFISCKHKNKLLEHLYSLRLQRSQSGLTQFSPNRRLSGAERLSEGRRGFFRWFLLVSSRGDASMITDSVIMETMELWFQTMDVISSSWRGIGCFRIHQLQQTTSERLKGRLMMDAWAISSLLLGKWRTKSTDWKLSESLRSYKDPLVVESSF